MGFSGLASIFIAKYRPLDLFTVVRHINLEVLTLDQIDEVQHEMKLSQLLCHQNIACYLANFVAGVHLWAVQPLMHYGMSVCVCGGGGGGGGGLSAGWDMACALVLVLGHSMSCVSRAWRNEGSVAYM